MDWQVLLISWLCVLDSLAKTSSPYCCVKHMKTQLHVISEPTISSGKVLGH